MRGAVHYLLFRWLEAQHSRGRRGSSQRLEGTHRFHPHDRGWYALRGPQGWLWWVALHTSLACTLNDIQPRRLTTCGPKRFRVARVFSWPPVRLRHKKMNRMSIIRGGKTWYNHKRPLVQGCMLSPICSRSIVCVRVVQCSQTWA